MFTRILALLFASQSLLLLAWTSDIYAQSTRPDGLRLYASVFGVRGSVVGSSISQFGPFVRTGDTSWRFLAKSNVYTFGLGFYGHGSGRRYYFAGGDGLHRSTDDGATWRVLTGWQTMEILSVLPHPVDSTLVYVGTPWGVYRTTDDGRTWHPRNNGFQRFFTVLAGNDRRSMDHLYAMSDDDLYRSTDGSAHWVPLGIKGSVLSFAQHPTKFKLLLAGVEDGGILRSIDDGKSWKKTNGLDKMSVYCVTFSPNGAVAYAAGWQSGLWESRDGGEKWTRLWEAPGVEAIFCIYVDPLSPDHLMVGTDGQGVFESFNAGHQWKFAGLAGGKVKQLSLYP